MFVLLQIKTPQKETIKQLLKVYIYISDIEKFRSGLCYFDSTIFYEQTNGIAMRGRVSSTTTEIYMQTYEHIAMSMALHPPKVWKRFVNGVYTILKRTHHINILHQNINLKST